MPNEHKEDACLLEIEKLLQMNGKSLKDYPPMPMSSEAPTFDVTNQLILQELNFNKDEYAEKAKNMRQLLTTEQLQIYSDILESVNSCKGGFFFVYGFGGTGKTFLWNILTMTLRGEGNIIINVASSGIAATLLPSGRTAHSRFAIPIEINEECICDINNNSPLARLLQVTKLII